VNKKIYIVDASRTAVGSLGKSLKDSSAVELGSSVINNSIKRCKIKSSEVDEVIMGQVLTGASGQNPC
jgi:acetyl-CoA C-acetyltransferase